MTAAKCKSCKRELRCSCGALVKEKDGLPERRRWAADLIHRYFEEVLKSGGHG